MWNTFDICLHDKLDVYLRWMWKMAENKDNNVCPKCKSTSLIIHGNNTGYTITDIYSEYFEIFRCNACGFEFSTDSNSKA